VEDLGSSNGTFINERKVGRGTAEPNDLVRFGELAFRVEGDTQHGTRAVDLDIPPKQLYLLIGAAAVTFVLLVVMIVVLAHKPTPVQAPGKEAIAKLSKQAAAHFTEGKRLLNEHKYLEAKSELDQSLELDPANVEGRRLRTLASRAPEDDQTERAASAKMLLGDRKGLEQAMRLYEDTTEGTAGHDKLEGKLVQSLVRFGDTQYAARAWADAAWALCRAYVVAPADSKPDASKARLMRDAERRVKDKAFPRCRATP
jgi:tetratricopeptide (TPR) repeat protein